MDRQFVSPVVLVVTLLMLVGCGAATSSPTPPGEAPSPLHTSAVAPSRVPATSSATIQPPASTGTLIIPGSWTATASMSQPHVDELTATLLPDGAVLAVGIGPTTTEIYNADTGTWSAGPPTNEVRGNHTATLLRDGRVLVAGGNWEVGLDSAEIYDPASQSWTAVEPMAQGRWGHTATLLGDGRVLVVGGALGNGEPISSAEIFDPTANSWTSGGELSQPRGLHNAVMLGDGRVLIAGGMDNNGNLSTAEIFDPAEGTWVPAANMIHARSYATASVLANGEVLLAGGDGRYAELFDPTDGTWTATSNMRRSRAQAIGLTLPDGRVLLAGGDATSQPSAEIYDPATATWFATEPMTAWRASPAAVVLNDGKVLVAGGFTDDGATAELFDAEAGSPTAGASEPPWLDRCERGCQGPIANGTFTSAGFIPGLQVTLSDGWFNTADYPEEIQLENGNSTVRFWQTAGATNETGELLTDIPRTVDGLTEWFVSNPDMVVSEPEDITIGDGIAAKTFTLDVSDANVNDDPGCPVRSCLNVLWIAPGHVFGIGIGSGERLYLFNLGTGTDARTVVVSLDSHHQTLAAETDKLNEILATLHVPEP